MIRQQSRVSLVPYPDRGDDANGFCSDLKFNETSANVVHMSIKPQDFMEDEDAKGTKATRTQSHDGTEGRSPGCRCIVM